MFLCFLFVLLINMQVDAKTEPVATETEVKAHVGTIVDLPCKVDVNQCGSLHSVKWYKDTSRIYVLSHAGSMARPEGDSTDRMTVEYSVNSMNALLRISPVKVEDEAIYKCEITYLEVIENCDVVQIVRLTTLIVPESVRILDNQGISLGNASVLGPKQEGTEVDIICEALGGKPIPKVTWYNGTTEIKRAAYTRIDDGEGVGTGRSKLQLTLSRGDLNARFECRVESDALDEPIISWISADVHVRPTKMELSGVKNHVVQGTNVLLICDVHGARPAATVRWVNGSIPITNESLVQTSPENNRDGTYTTKSSLIFKASHWENGKTIHCYGENEVIKSNNEPELHEVLVLDVRYPPVITVQPLNITKNETTSLTARKNNVLLKCSYFANPQELKSVSWSKDGKNISLSDPSGKFVGGTKDNPPLLINNVTREDMGEYTCWLSNEVGSEKSEDSIYLNVQYPPDVDVVMEPSFPIKAIEKSNVLLECNVTSGNPSNLQKVRWFLDGDLMKEFPECNYTSVDENGVGDGNGGPLCGLDPSILSLETVDETFAGNYTCQGKNVAGWGPESEPQELVVYYPPSPAKLRYYPSQVIKGAWVTLECNVDRLGRPDNVTYIWYRGAHQMNEITSNLTITPVRLETKSNFTCIAQNEGGQSEPATVDINVYAPPAFIQKLPTYQGVLYSSQNINLTCRVECSPLCSIVWLKDGHLLDTNNNPLYYVKTNIYKPDLQKNDFESIESTLIWNMTAWPDNKLNRTAPNSNYTCKSHGNTFGAGVSSTIEIAVDYPPEDLTVSTRVVNVIENQTPSLVKCHGKGHPALSYQWRKNATSEPIERNEELRLGRLGRSDTGGYICEASNKHGTQTAIVYFNVQYAPECSITTGEKNGSPALVCTAHANPQEVTFTWKVRESNDTSIESAQIIQEGLRSYLILDSSVDRRTYLCYANNSVGISVACERDVAGSRPWWKGFITQDKLIMIIASIIAIIICVIIVCIVIILLCRRKRADTKSPNLSSIGDKMKLGAAPPVGGSADPSSTDPDKGYYENLPFHGIQNPPNKSSDTPVPAPRCKKHQKRDIIYANVSKSIENARENNLENNDSQIEITEAQIHAPKEESAPKTEVKTAGTEKTEPFSSDKFKLSTHALKNSPTLKVSPNFIKPKTESPKGALSLQIQAKKKASPIPSAKSNSKDDESAAESIPFVPKMPLIDQSKWIPNVNSNWQNAFYTLTSPHFKQLSGGIVPPQYSATIPHQQKHSKLLPRALFQEQLPKSKSFSSKSKQKKHFQIPLQKCHSFKFQTAESYFQPIKNIHEENLMKNGYITDYPETSSHQHLRQHKREKVKQKTKGPLVLRRPSDYHENVQFQENIHNSVQLQYPQPMLGHNNLQNATNKPNGVVYADLDMPTSNSRKSSDSTSSSCKSKTQKTKPKTEYATLKFNDIGQEIDV